MIVVPDCNVIVAAGTKDGFVRYVLRRIIDEQIIVASEEIIAEYVRVSRYPKFSREAAAYITDTIGSIEGCARLVEARPCGFPLPDPDDIPYIDAAITGGADFIVTGNLKHFPERRYGAVRVLSVREFAEIGGLVP